MKIIKGDLIELAQAGQFDLIIHGCNCFHTMGAGIAKQIRKTFPLAYKADRDTEYGSREKLGSFSFAGFVHQKLIVVNAYTQFHYRGRRNADYHAIESAFRSIRSAIENEDGFFGKYFPINRIGYPKIGAGLAGGDWDRISSIIDKVLAGMDHTLVKLP